ncbi:MAG TPA: efflux RND transporter periplasmic adaptor subunit [Desulfobacteraceae bacterium]|nr:efflux RND transporter periplasmic adaptor subunit [Desulfobacteraceae bacterium]
MIPMKKKDKKDAVLPWVFLLQIMALCFVIPTGPVARAETEGFDGLVEPRLVVKLGSAAFGVIEKIHVDRGDNVKEGQVLATLQSGVEKATMELAKTQAQFEATVQARKAELDFAVRNQERRKELFEKKTLPLQDWDETETRRILAEISLKEAVEKQRLAEMEYRRALETYRRTIIKSPLTGVVVERFMHPGEYIENQPLMTLAQIDPLYVEVVMTVANLGIVEVGQKATIRPESPVGGLYEAEVIVVDRVLDGASGTFGVRLELPNPDYRLPPGLKCKVMFHR